MLKFIISAVLAANATLAVSQTRLHITNLTITEKDRVVQGPPVTASLQGEQGRNPLVLYTDQYYTIDGLFKVRTYKVKRESPKQGAVYLTITMKLHAGGKKNKHIVEKTFYAEQERASSFSEEFLIKNGIEVRKITVTFDGRID